MSEVEPSLEPICNGFSRWRIALATLSTLLWPTLQISVNRDFHSVRVTVAYLWPLPMIMSSSQSPLRERLSTIGGRLINTGPVNQLTPTAIGAIALSADLLAAQVVVQITTR